MKFEKKHIHQQYLSAYIISVCASTIKLIVKPALMSLTNDTSVPMYSLMITHTARLEVGTLAVVEGIDEGEMVGIFIGVFIKPFWLIYVPKFH